MTGNGRYRAIVPRYPTAPLLVLTVSLSALVVAGCGSSGSTAKPAASSTTTSTLSAPNAEPAGFDPSESAKMICEPEAQKDIAGNVGLEASQVTAPTWVDHLYSCSYVYPTGTMTVSVKELSSEAETTAYFDSLGTLLGRRPGPASLGKTAFFTDTDSLVLRKDFKVLYVDLTQIPAKFGTPAGDHENIALRAGFAVLSCWTGA